MFVGVTVFSSFPCPLLPCTAYTPLSSNSLSGNLRTMMERITVSTSSHALPLFLWERMHDIADGEVRRAGLILDSAREPCIRLSALLIPDFLVCSRWLCSPCHEIKACEFFIPTTRYTKSCVILFVLVFYFGG